MNATDSTDPVHLLGQLRPDAIRERIAELDHQRRALAVLLRAANARERRAKLVSDRDGKGGAHAR